MDDVSASSDDTTDSLGSTETSSDSTDEDLLGIEAVLSKDMTYIILLATY